MTLDEALEAAILGERVTAAHMQPGWFVNYPTPFEGWFRNTPHGGRSQFIETDEDRAADWCIVADPMAEAESEGAKAWPAGLPLSANPHEVLTGLYAAWVRGYTRAMREDNILSPRDVWGKPPAKVVLVSNPSRDRWGRAK